MRATLTWAATALMMAASAVTASAQTPTEINFGVISTEASMNQKKNWEPFLQAMSKATGLKVNGFYATDYAGVIEAMRFNKIHLAWHGNKSGISRSRERRGLCSHRGPRRKRGLLFPRHRAQGQSLRQDR
jgi:phosphate/phosphite/phosphonate ABC transporter binding protein